MLGILVIACSAIGPVSAGQPPEQSTERLQSVRLGEETAELVAVGSRCGVRHGQTLVELRLPIPCRFLTRGEGMAPTVEEYGASGTVTLVAGPLAHPEDYSLVGDRVPASACSHIAQAVILRDGKLILSDPLIEPLGFCAESAPDEKYYYGLAYDRS